VLELYRIRWQIEMHIKRMKSIVHIGDIPAHRVDAERTYLLAKLILALIVEALVMRLGKIPPTEQGLQRGFHSLWRLTRTCWQSLKNAIRGAPAIDLEQLTLPHFQRYLCSTTRVRQSQFQQVAELIQTRVASAVQLPLPCPIQCLS
jgi:hypothetical protein